MKPYNGFKAEEAKNTPNCLPAGGYVCQIKSAEVELHKNDDGSVFEKLVIKYDVYEGDYTEFFKDQYNNSTFADKKYKGVKRIAIPDESSEFAASQKKAFNNFIFAIENSNPNYHWDWNEAGLANKLVGFIFRNKEWEMDGRTGWTTEPAAVITVDKVRSGDYKIPADKPLNPTASPVAAPETFNTVTEDDLPF